MQIGGQTYPVTGTAAYATGMGCGPGGTTCENNWTHAAGIGLVSWRNVNRRTLFPTHTRQTDGQLSYARVGGQTFGTRVVAGEEPVREARLALSASPNPARGAFRLSVAGSAFGTVAVAVFDVAGRRVWSGLSPNAGETVVDLSPFPGGVYVVRAQDAGGAVATLRVAHLP